MKYLFRQSGVSGQAGDVAVAYHAKGMALQQGMLAELDRVFDGHLLAHLAAVQFHGQLGESIILPTIGKMKARALLIMGLGEKQRLDADLLRKVGGHVARRAREAKARTIVTSVPAIGQNGLTARIAATALVEGFGLGAYHYPVYKSEKHRAEQPVSEAVEMIVCEPKRAPLQAIERAVPEAVLRLKATLTARDLVNTPPSDMTPAHLFEAAHRLVKSAKRLTLKTLDKAEMESLGMHATLAVARGSVHAPVGVHLTYKSKGGAKKRIALVGKAVTFDSGGLSLKPADSMLTMKCDMAGAAAVIGVFQALAELDLPLEVHGIFLAVENMPSGSAYRPGDVVKAMNGTTIEVLNTDAEGRVTLADALSYAVTLKPDAIIDLATLTGACVAALGDDLSGLLTNDTRLGQRLLKAAQAAGEGVWELPLVQAYDELIKSKVADIKNIGGRSAGAITAGLFLQHFVDKVPWAHLDIAGPAFAEHETRPDIPHGGTGAGVRLLISYLQGLV